MDLNGLLERTLGGMGYEIVDIERPGRGALIRIFIDKPGGVSVDDCAVVSQQVSRVLTVEGVDYARLEVSSPGLDRPLKRERDFVRFAGQRARVRVRTRINGQRNFVGTLRGAGAGQLQLEVDGQVMSFEIDDIDTARLVPNL